MKSGGLTASIGGVALVTLALCAAQPARAGEACVMDPAAVATRLPTAAMGSAALPAPMVAKLDTAARTAFAQAAAPGAIVGVRTPQGHWTAAYGKADPATGEDMAVGMHTRVGSVTKTFVGTVLLQLAEAGKLSLDDPISKYVAGIPNGDRISLRMLADMTSGIASYTRDAAFTDAYFADPSKVFPPDRLVAIAVKASPAFAPGARFDYSNSNFILLGLVIEKVTQQPIADVLQARILAPLALAGTSWPGDSAKMPLPYAHGFTLQGSGKPDAPADATHWNPAWGWTAGEVISTMEDLLVYGRALGTGQGLLGKHTQVERLTSFPQAGGYGIGLGCAGGWVGHTGEIPGYNTTVFYDTRTDTTVVVQTNSDISSGACPAGETLAKDRRDLACSAPATRIFTAIAGALGRPFLRPQQ